MPDTGPVLPIEDNRVEDNRVEDNPVQDHRLGDNPKDPELTLAALVRCQLASDIGANAFVVRPRDVSAAFEPTQDLGTVWAALNEPAPWAR